MNTPVAAIDVVEDYSDRARCDEGFLRLRRLRCQNRREDGTRSIVYRVDVIDRPTLDAVAVLVHRTGPAGREILTRKNLRPAAYFREGKPMTLPDPGSHLFVEEIVAGVLEAEDRGDEGLRHRAVEEVKEEAGLEVLPEEIVRLGGPFFVAPGILSEKVYLCAVDVTGKEEREPKGDGTPLEEGATLRWREIHAALRACREGEISDAKTELALTRLLATLPPG
jgi:ADP-ribose pyrophosphatase